MCRRCTLGPVGPCLFLSVEVTAEDLLRRTPGRTLSAETISGRLTWRGRNVAGLEANYFIIGWL